MTWSTRPLGAPAEDILTVAAAKAALAIESDFTGDDSLIETYRDFARDHIETSFNLKTRTQEVELLLQCFPRGHKLQIPFGPVQSVEYVRYVDANDEEHDFTGYETRLYANPPEILLKYAGTWPASALKAADAVRIGLTVGYLKGDSPESYPVPNVIPQAMRLLIGHAYENNAPMVDDATELVLRRLLANTRLY